MTSGRGSPLGAQVALILCELTIPSDDLVAVASADDFFPGHAQVAAEDEVVISVEVGVLIFLERGLDPTTAADLSAFAEERYSAAVNAYSVSDNLLKPFVRMAELLLVFNQLLVSRCHRNLPVRA